MVAETVVEASGMPGAIVAPVADEDFCHIDLTVWASRNRVTPKQNTTASYWAHVTTSQHDTDQFDYMVWATPRRITPIPGINDAD